MTASSERLRSLQALWVDDLHVSGFCHDLVETFHVLTCAFSLSLSEGLVSMPGLRQLGCGGRAETSGKGREVPIHAECSLAETPERFPVKAMSAGTRVHTTVMECDVRTSNGSHKLR